MPQKARRIRDISSNDCEAAQSGNTRTRGGSGGGRDVFHFVNVNPQSDIQRAENRTLIRSHASKYIWRQHRAGRTDTADRVDPADTRVNSSTSPPTSDSTPSPHLTDVQPFFVPTQNFPAVTLPQQYPIHKSAPLAVPSNRYPIGLESATPNTQYELHPGQASSFVVPPELHTNDLAPAISAPALTSIGSAPTPEASLRTPFIMPISAASALSTMNFPTQGEEDKESSSSEHYKNRVIQKSDVLPASIKVEESLPESRTGLQRLPLKPNSRNREEPIQTRASRRNDTEGRKESMISSSPFNQIKNWLGDPLCTIPSTVDEARMNKFLYYSAVELWPGLCPGAENKQWGLNVAAEQWLPYAFKNEALLKAFMYGAASHMQMRLRIENSVYLPQTREEKLERIVCEAEAIKHLNKMVTDPKLAICDETLMAVLCMAFNRVDYTRWQDNDIECQVPLRSLQWLDVYGSLSLNDQHVKGLMALVNLRGGLQRIKMSGLAETLSFAGIMLATKYLTKLRLPFYPIYEETVLGRTPSWPTLDPSTMPLMLERCLRMHELDPINNARLPENLKQLLRDIRDYNAVVIVFTQGSLPYLEMAALADRRNWLQYRLCSLPSSNEIGPEYTTQNPAYEPTRLSLLAYSMLVTFFLPPANRPFARLSAYLKQALIRSKVPSSWTQSNVRPNIYTSQFVPPSSPMAFPFNTFHPISSQAPVLFNALTASTSDLQTPLGVAFSPTDSSLHLLLWVLFIGAITADGTPHRFFFMDLLSQTIDLIGISDWLSTKQILRSVIWMDSVCDPLAKKIWEQIRCS